MKPYLIAATVVGMMIVSVAMAQVSTNRTNDAPPPPTADQGQSKAGEAITHASNAASINGNPAVATSSASSMEPAKGKNSFTLAEARVRLERHGYTQVSNLKKDPEGVWRGQATKDGSQQDVWLDYKGDVGTGK
ncbi:MAG TPA: hypothetical protein VHB27_03360 [Rhodopila sp.]|uniref:hypothetical protein n=1 Tax=Rhodopila sp. TaxID=2480087 RepID=UPI002CFDD53F|nr:hypothetical protein [Rhodopila sp.]HVY14240.1 hypothetical protein [Rhodopila sp.]